MAAKTRASLFLPVLLIVLALTAGMPRGASSQTPENLCQLLPTGWVGIASPAGSSYAAPDGTAKTGCFARAHCAVPGDINSGCPIQFWLLRVSDARAKWEQQDRNYKNGRGTQPGLGEANFTADDRNSSVLSFYRGEYFVHINADLKEQAFIRSSAAQVDAAIKNALNPTAPIPPRNPAQPPAPPAQQPPGEVKANQDAELLLAEALSNSSIKDTSNLMDGGQNISGALEAERNMRLAWSDMTGESVGKSPGGEFMASVASLAARTHEGKPLFPPLKSKTLQQVLAVMAVRSSQDPDWRLAANRLVMLLIRQDLAASGLRPQ